MADRNKIDIEVSVDEREALRALNRFNREMASISKTVTQADKDLMRMARGAAQFSQSVEKATAALAANLRLQEQRANAMRSDLELSTALVRVEQSKTAAFNDQAAAVARNLTVLALFSRMMGMLAGDLRNASEMVRQTTVEFDRMAQQRLLGAQRFLAAAQMEMAALGGDAGAAGGFAARMREAKAAVDAFTNADLSKTAAIEQESTALVRTTSITVTFVGMLRQLEAAARAAGAQMLALDTHASSLQARFARTRQLAGPGALTAQPGGGRLARDTIIEVNAINQENRAFRQLTGEVAGATKAITGMTVADQKKTKALNEENTALNQSTGKTKNFKSSMGELGTVLAGFTGLGMLEFGKNALQAAADIDALKKALETAVPAGTDTAKLFEQLRQLSELTPGLTMQTTLEAFVALMPSFGRNIAATTKLIVEFANAVQSAGKGPQEFQLLMVQLGQAAAKGKVLWEDMRLILQQAPVLRELVNKAFGTQDPEELRKRAGSIENFFLQLLKQLEQQQRALPSVATKTQQFANSLKMLQAELGMTLAELIPFRKLTKDLQDLQKSWEGLPDWVKNTAGSIFIAATAVVTLGVALRGLYFALLPFKNPWVLAVLTGIAAVYGGYKAQEQQAAGAPMVPTMGGGGATGLIPGFNMLNLLKPGMALANMAFGTTKGKAVAGATAELTEEQKAMEEQKRLGKELTEGWQKYFDTIIAGQKGQETAEERRRREAEARARAREIQKAEQAAESDLIKAIGERRKVLGELVGHDFELQGRAAELRADFEKTMHDRIESVTREGGERRVQLTQKTTMAMWRKYYTDLDTLVASHNVKQANKDRERIE